MDNKSYLKLKEQVNHGNLEMPLGIYPHKYSNTADNYSHWHDEMEFIYVSEGEAEIFIDFKKTHLSKGNFVVIPKGSIHYITDIENKKVAYTAVVFNLSLIEGSTLDYSQIKFINNILENKMLFTNLIHSKNLGYEDIIFYFNKLVNSYKEKNKGYQLEIKGYLQLIFSFLFKGDYIIKKVYKEFSNETMKIEKLKEVIKYIHENYKKSITIKELADISKYSEYHFLRFFKSQTGKTCTQFINYFRIEKATLLLINSDLTITEISYEVGFGDVSYFIKIFKKYFNISPTKYRKLNSKI